METDEKIERLEAALTALKPVVQSIMNLLYMLGCASEAAGERLHALDGKGPLTEDFATEATAAE